MNIKKFVNVLLGLTALFFIIGFVQMVFNRIMISDYNTVFTPNYGYAINVEVIEQTQLLLSLCIVFVAIGAVGIAGAILFGYQVFKSKNQKINARFRLVFPALIVISIALLCVFFPQFKQNLPPFNNSYPNYVNIYEYSFAAEAQAMTIIPITTLIIFFCYSLVDTISSFKKGVGKVQEIKDGCPLCEGTNETLETKFEQTEVKDGTELNWPDRDYQIIFTYKNKDSTETVSFLKCNNVNM